ncbi:MAG TPA: peptide deformylase [Coriobacteriia bacterium]
MQVLAHPNPALKQRADEVDPRADRQLVRLAKQMAKIMYASHGVGLAATQLGVQKRIIVFDVGEEKQPVALCNPVIVERSQDTETDEEGCLSLPGLTVPVERATSVICEGADLKGERVRLEADALLARVLQHETDHLDGILILDRATPGERKAAVRRYMEALEAESAG